MIVATELSRIIWKIRILKPSVGYIHKNKTYNEQSGVQMHVDIYGLDISIPKIIKSETRVIHCYTSDGQHRREYETLIQNKVCGT